jgi:hypothetical protein
MKKIITYLTTLFLFLFFVTQTHAFKKESFITTTVLVRGQEGWGLVAQQPLDFPLFYYEQASQSGIPTSYMLRYDAVEDKEISSKLANLVATDPTQILGGLLEVTPNLAKKANANYQNNGSLTTANHIFLSGYSREDRQRIIDTYMSAFFNKFGNYPPVVGVDSLDSFSFNYLVSHYSVIGAFVKDETYRGENLSQWGGYLAEPYLPSKTNILLPAQNTKNKINGVVFKWSPSDPFNFLKKNPLPRPILDQVSDILNVYTLKSLNESTHTNIRLDNNYQLVFNGQENESLKTFSAQQAITNLVKKLKDNQDKHTLSFKSTAEMGEIIKARYPETSSASFFILGDVYWYQNPFYRLALRQAGNKTEIIDFHVYDPKITGQYFHQKNVQTTSYQEVQGIIDSVKDKKDPMLLDIDLEKAEITSEYWDLILSNGEKIVKLQPQEIIFEKVAPPPLETNQIKIKTSKNSTRWLVNPVPPFNRLINSNLFVPKLGLVFLIVFLILKVFTKKPPKTIFLGLVFGFTALIPVAFSGQIYSFGLGLWGPNGHDAIFHLSVINSLKDSLVNLSHPQLSGFFLQNYHIGVDWIVALVSKITGIEPASLFLRDLPIVLVAIIVSQLIKLLSKWKFSKQATYLSLFFAFLAGSLGFIFTLLSSGNLFAGESLFWMNQSVSMFLNPPFAFSIALLLIFINLYSSKDSSKRNKFILLILVGGILAQIKIYAFVLLLLSLLFLKEIKLLIGVGLVGLLLSLPTLGLQGSPFVFSPLWFPKSMIAAQDKLNWQKFAQAWQVYEVNGPIFKLFIVNAISLGIFLLGNLGIRVIGLLNLLKGKAQSSLQRTPSISLVKALIISGLIIPLLFIQTNNPWNTIQFSYYSLFFLSIFTAQAIASKKHSLIYWIIIFTLTIPTTIGTLKDYITPYSASKISFTELQALETLKNQEKGVVLSPLFNSKESGPFPEPKSLYAYTSTAYISALSGQPEYLSDLINLNITGFNYKERAKNVQRFYKTQDSSWAKSFMQKENISYIYQTPMVSLQLNPKETCLLPIFTSGEIIIYKFNCYE